VDAQSVKNTDTAARKGYDAGKKVTMIGLRQVSKRYDEVHALHPLDLSVRKGQLVTLLGPAAPVKRRY